jgi:cell division protein FtsB
MTSEHASFAKIRRIPRKEPCMKLKRAGIITKIVIFALIVYASVTLINLRAQIDAARTQQLTLKEQVTQKEALTAELQYKIDHSDDKDIIADVARNDLGYVEPGEKVFLPSN